MHAWDSHGKLQGYFPGAPYVFPCYPTGITDIAPSIALFTIPYLIPSCDDYDDDRPLPQAPFDRDSSTFTIGDAGPAATQILSRPVSLPPGRIRAVL